MNFFEAQKSALRQTLLMIALFLLAIFIIIVLIYHFVYYVILFVEFFLLGCRDFTIICSAIKYTGPDSFFDFNQFHNPLFQIIFIVLGIFFIGLSLIRVISLSKPGAYYEIMNSINGQCINNRTDNLAERRLLNIVEEMSIASGVTLPTVFVIEKDNINAFVMGLDINHVLLGVTRGAINDLTREEMQGVIGHEFSHILNNDMLLNTKLSAVIYGINYIGLLGSHLSGPNKMAAAWSWGSGPRSGLLAGNFLVFIGWLGMFLSSAIRATICRQREYLADASSVQFTRSQAIASALDRIRTSDSTSKINPVAASDIAHLFFTNAVSNYTTNLFSSHPPLESRIKRIIPNWDGITPLRSQLNIVAPLPDASLTTESNEPPPISTPIPLPDKKTDEAIKQLAPLSPLAPLAVAPLPSTELKKSNGNNAGSKIQLVRSVVSQIGEVSLDSQVANRLHQDVPDITFDMLKDSYSVRALVYTFLFGDEKCEFENTRLDYLKNHADTGVYDLVLQLLPKTQKIKQKDKLMILQEAIVPLSDMSLNQYELFLDNMAHVIIADNIVSIFEWGVQAIIAHAMNDYYYPNQKIGKATKHDMAYAITMLIRCNNKEQEKMVFEQMVKELSLSLQHTLEDFDAKQLFDSMQRLAKLSPNKKEEFVSALIYVVIHNTEIAEKEEVLLRVYLRLLDCPLPAIFNRSSTPQ